MNKRLLYIIVAALCFVLGFILFVTAASMPFFIANYVPNILWACSIYFLVAFIFAKNAAVHGAIAIVLCILIESLQTYNFPVLSFARSNILGAFVLGTSFLLSDIFCYIIAVTTCFIFDFIISGRKRKKIRHRR